MFCTHLHIDHTGWNTRLVDGRWVPTFPRAKYIFHRREYETGRRRAAAGAARNRRRSGAELPADCRGGPAVLVDENYSLDDTVFLSLTPGHSPYHCCVHIRSSGQEAIVSAT